MKLSSSRSIDNISVVVGEKVRDTEISYA